MPRYAYLGPEGTFTESALKKITGDSDQRTAYANVTATLDAVRRSETDFALVPIENSVEGVVARTLDELAIGDPLVIVAETTIKVSFALITRAGFNRDEIKQIATHPHAESQCRSYIAKQFPHAEIIPMSSTAAAAEAVARGQYSAAIAAATVAGRNDLEVM